MFVVKDRLKTDTKTILGKQFRLIHDKCTRYTPLLSQP